MIVEADEFDRSFLYLKPDIAVITSVGADHLDIYDDKSDLFLAFHQFASQVKNDGLLLVESSIDYIFPTPANGLKLTYSAKSKQSTIFVEQIQNKNNKYYFNFKSNLNKNITQNDSLIGINMPGIHNISNALAASFIASYLGLSKIEMNDAFSTFKGINRRFQKRNDSEKLVYIDDCAHHPNEVKATIATVKDVYPLRKLTVIFQPHLYTRDKRFCTRFC